MKKIYIITIHCQTNFGSVMQAFALNRYISALGYRCEIINYRPNYIVNNFGYGIKGIIKRLLAFFSGNKSRKAYDSFINNNMHVTDKIFTSFHELENEVFDSALFIAGSDQLWNVGYKCGKDDSYKLSFVYGVPKISYATSLNCSNMNDNDKFELKEKIKEFQSISLRESSSVDMFIRDMGLEAVLVCDPVFLLSSDVYLNMCSKNTYGHYILVYLVDNFDLLSIVVNTIKKRTSYKVIYACGTVPKCNYDIHIESPDPIEMLSLVNNAEIIITGSFHATAFSHIFHKNFMVILPNNHERITSLLSVSGLENRIISDENYSEIIDLEIDYSEAEKRMDEFIENSKEWLISSIKKAMDK